MSAVSPLLTNAKAIAGGIAVPVSQIVVWVLTGPLALEVPEEIQTAIAALVVALVVWLVPNKEK